MHQCPHLLWCEWHIDTGDAERCECIQHSVNYGRRSRNTARFSYALGAKWIIGRRRLDSVALPHQNLTRGFTQLAAVGSAEVLLAEFGKGNGPWNTSTCPCPSWGIGRLSPRCITFCAPAVLETSAQPASIGLQGVPGSAVR
jgi:hypothetical protein